MTGTPEAAPHDEGGFWRRLTVATALLGTVLSISAAGLEWRSILRQGDAETARSAVQLRDLFTLHFASIESELAATAAYLSTATRLDPRAFASFYRAATSDETPRSSRAVAFMLPVPAERLDQLQAFVDYQATSYAASGYPAFRAFPAHGGPTLLPALLVEPPPARAGVFGFDIASSTERLDAARRALASGRMALSTPVALSQDPEAPAESLLLLARVSLRSDVALGSGLPAATGLVAAGVTPRHILEQVIGWPVSTQVSVSLRFEEGAARALPLTDAPAAARPGRWPWSRHRHSARPLPLRLGDKRLTLHYTEVHPPGPEELLRVFGVLALGLLGTFFATAYVWRVDQQSRLVAEELARKEQALRRAEEVALEAQKLESVGRLVGGVAHDFNNLLSVMLGNVELVRDGLSPDQQQECLDDVLGAINRGKTLTRQLLAFGRKANLTPEAVDLNGFTMEMELMLGRVLPENIAVETILAESLQPAWVDRDQLANAVLNLGINARDAMPDGGQLTLETSALTVHPSEAARRDDELAPGAYVAIAVSDTGTGMSPEALDRAFEPFYTTKPAGAGSGLGLSMVYGFARQSGGTVRLSSTRGIGTTVRICLPVARPDRASVPRPLSED